MVNRKLVMALEDIIKDVVRNGVSVEQVVGNIEIAFNDYGRKHYGDAFRLDSAFTDYVCKNIRQRHFTF